MKAEEGHATRADAVIGATSPSEAVGGAMPARHQWLPALSMTTVQHLPGGSSDGSRQPSPITPGIDEPRTLKPPRPDVWGLRETCAAAAATPAARRQLAPVLRAHRFQASQLIAPEWDLGFAPASIAAPSGTHSTSSHPPAQSITAALGASLIPRWGMQRTASAGPRIALHGLPAGWQQHPHRSAREADDESNGGAGEDTRAAQPHAREPAVHAPLEATAGHQPAPTHKGARVASAPAYRIPGVQPRLRPPLIGGSPARSGLSQPRLTPKAAPALSMLILSPVPDSLARLGADRAAHRYDQCGPSAADERCAEPDVPASASPVDVLFATPTHQGWIGDGAASGGMRATSPVRAMAPLSPALAGAFGRDERPHPAGGQGALDGSALGEPGTPAMDTPACSSLNAARAVRAPRLDNSLTGRRPPKPRDAENEAFERPRAVQRRQGALTNGSGEHRAARDGATAHELPRAQSARALDPLVATLSAPRRARAREGVASARAIARGGGVHLDAAAKPRARRALHGQSKQRTAAGAQRCADEAAAASIVGASAAVATAGPAQDGVNASHDWLVQKQFELMLMIRCKVNSTMVCARCGAVRHSAAPDSRSPKHLARLRAHVRGVTPCVGVAAAALSRARALDLHRACGRRRSQRLDRQGAHRARAAHAWAERAAPL